MRRVFRSFLLLLGLAILATPMCLGAQSPKTNDELMNARPGRDPRQPLDTEYTRKIKEYTTEPYFLSPIVDYMPASKTVPTPEKTLGNIAGAPGKLPYSKEVYEYMRLLAKSTPRVRVYSIGTTEEGREMIAVAIASDQLMAKLDANKADLAKLADPRTIGMNDSLADQIAKRAAPVYYITGTIHSSEAGAPTALMEMAYRLAVDESPYIKNIRDHMITLITPIVEVDGRDRIVDLYEYRKKHPNDVVPGAIYWGKYVEHDNNRDAMGLTLKLSQNVLNTYLGWDAQLLHDLHESEPFLYDNTIGDGPYNAWLDPILTNEWQLLGWNNVNEMTRWGMPGVYAFGNFDTWSPGYLMFMAATHNGISRLYETYGNGGTAETEDHTLSASETSRTWYRQNPPLSHVRWSLRDNNNYEMTGILLSENYFATNRVYFLRNFYDKSKRSILKAKTEGPAAYIFPADDPRLGSQAELLRVLQKQHVEISRATAPFTATLPVRGAASVAPAGGGRGNRGGGGGRGAATTAAPTTRDFPAGSYVVRMDQPYSRIADALLDYQYWAPNDPQKTPYDDTGWTFPEGFGVEAVRITDPKVLDAPMTRLTDSVHAVSGVTGTGTIFAINHNADNALITLRYQLRSANIQMAEESFDAAGQKFARGSFVISGVPQADLDKTTTALGLKAYAIPAAPSVAMHPARAARVAVLHTWTSTQTEGWWRQAFDVYGVPYDYVDPAFIGKTADLRAKYDVIVVGPGLSQSAIDGMPMYRNAEPWKNSPETPNIGTYAQTDDIRPGMQIEGLLNLRNFVQQGGVIVAAGNSADFFLTTDLARGVTAGRPGSSSRVVGSLLRTDVTDAASPVMYGIPTAPAVYSERGESFNAGGGGGRGGGGGGGGFAAGGGRGNGAAATRATGRGTPDDPDVVQGRPAGEGSEVLPPLPGDSSGGGRGGRGGGVAVPLEFRVRPLLRFETQDKLLVSGLLDGGSDIAGQTVVIDVPSEKGHYILFADNPIYRGETIGNYFMVFNAMLSFDNLGAGRSDTGGGGGGRGRGAGAGGQ
ncbi:MAG TPA: M14 family zinc carboxypeptidase [Gemmatimonadales bacterium]